MKNLPFLLILLFASCSPPAAEDPNAQHRLDSMNAAYEEQQKSESCTNKPGAPQPKTVEWKTPSALTAEEEKFCGTWNAMLSGSYLSTGSVAITVDPHNGKSGMDALVDAVEKNHRVDDGCAWMELYNDHTGFWSACMVQQKHPQPVQVTDFTSGKDMNYGTHFSWYLEGKLLHFRFDDCLFFPLPQGDSTVEVRVKFWDMRVRTLMPIDADDTGAYSGYDLLPEYGYRAKTGFIYDYSPKFYLGETGEFKRAVTN